MVDSLKCGFVNCSLSPTLISGLSAQGIVNPQLSVMPKTEWLSDDIMLYLFDLDPG